MDTQRSFFILYILFILSVSIFSLHIPVLSTEECCWAQTQSPEQPTGLTDIKSGQQPQSPSQATRLEQPVILPQLPDKNSAETQNYTPAITSEKTETQVPSAMQKTPVKGNLDPDGQVSDSSIREWMTSITALSLQWL